MKASRWFAAIVAALALVQLSPSPPGVAYAEARGREAAPPIASAGPAPRVDPVVVVVMDGVRWQEIFRGADPVMLAAAGKAQAMRRRPVAPEALAPNLHALLAERGAALGAPGRSTIRASGPRFVSLPAYREIFSGASSLDCLDNHCPRITRPTMVDELRDRGGRAAVFASWTPIAFAAARHAEGVVLSAGQGDTKEEPWPGDGDFRPDRSTAKLALDHLERERPDFLFVGLGEPDEYAHRGDYLGYLDAIAAADAVVGEIVEALRRMGARGARTHLFVTTDHGRASTFRDHGGAYPESAPVWLVASGPQVRARGAIVTDEPARLADLAPTMRTLLGLAAPPTTPGVVPGRVMTALLDDARVSQR
ncbi:MAG TPA: alkaline phosphatase family protein [Labilithrix sp.]|nr:alkaline phosphatase family protein [Labilithrix sp.]